jgi:integrase
MSYKPHATWPGWWTIDYRVIDHVQKGDKVVKTSVRIREHMEGTEEEAADYERRVRGVHVSSCRTHVSPPFKDIAAEFKTWATTNRSENYVKSIGWNLKNLIPAFGIFPPHRITDAMIEAYKAANKTKPVRCNQEVKLITTIVNWGADQKRNYCKSLPFKPEKLKVFKKLPQTPDSKQFDDLLVQIAANFDQARMSPEQRIHKIAMILIMYETGMRWIECRHLKWENIRKSDGRLYLDRTKTNAGRFTFLSKEIMEILDPIWGTDGFMFINPKTEKIYTTMGKSLRKAAKKCNVPLRGTHTLRHCLGTDSQDAKGDLLGTQGLLGHADIKSTVIYTHTSTSQLKRLLTDVIEYRANKRHLHLVQGGKKTNKKSLVLVDKNKTRKAA